MILPCEVFTSSEVAAMLRVSDRQIRRLIERGDLEAIRVGGIWRIKKESLSAWIDRQSDVTTATGSPKLPVTY